MALRQAIWDAFKAFPTWSRSAPVCQACAHRLRTWPMERYDHEAIRTGTKEPSEISFELTRDVLVESALTGCPLCTIAMHTLRLHGTVNSLTIRYQLLNTNPQIDPGNLDLFRVWETWSETDTDPDGQQQQQEHQSIYDFWMYAHAENPAAALFKTRPVNPAVAAPSAFQRARGWIDECCRSHPDCPKLEVPTMPTRVIDVGTPASQENPRLVVTNGLKGQYAALSYCWGGEQPDSLQQDRLSAYSREIPTEKLPQTIKDAITVTRNLGLRYLWVDSLCIIQDSELDKRSEISRMRLIFRHAFVTISAATAKTVFAGFLQQRPPPLPSVSIPITCPDGAEGAVCLYQDAGESHLLYSDSDHPIEARAWTLEEKVLSPRVLLYSSTHLRWLCDSRQYSDGGAQENFMDYDAARYRLPLEMRAEIPHPSRNNVSTESVYSSWRILVAEYSKRRLTAPRDKLRAIGGLAEQYARITNDVYCSGLWKSQLPTELLWRRNSLTEAGRPRERPTGYRAPSWSWASIEGEIAMKGSQIEAVDFEVLSCTVVPLHAWAPYGEVNRADLRLRARTRQIWWHRINERYSEREGGAEMGVGIADSLDDSMPASLAVIGLAISANHGLILMPKGDDSDTYTRVGWFYFDDDLLFRQTELSEVTII